MNTVTEQVSLSQLAKQLYQKSNEGATTGTIRGYLKIGAEWQKQQKPTEEEMIKFCESLADHSSPIRDSGLWVIERNYYYKAIKNWVGIDPVIPDENIPDEIKATNRNT